MHGLIFETSVCYWQNQPGFYFVWCRGALTNSCTDYFRSKTWDAFTNRSARRAEALLSCQPTFFYFFTIDANRSALCQPEQLRILTKTQEETLLASHLQLPHQTPAFLETHLIRLAYFALDDHSWILSKSQMDEPDNQYERPNRDQLGWLMRRPWRKHNRKRVAIDFARLSSKKS